MVGAAAGAAAAGAVADMSQVCCLVVTGMVGYELGYWELFDATNLVEDASGDQSQICWLGQKKLEI